MLVEFLVCVSVKNRCPIGVAPDIQRLYKEEKIFFSKELMFDEYIETGYIIDLSYLSMVKRLFIREEKVSKPSL